MSRLIRTIGICFVIDNETGCLYKIADSMGRKAPQEPTAAALDSDNGYGRFKIEINGNGHETTLCSLIILDEIVNSADDSVPDGIALLCHFQCHA